MEIQHKRKPINKQALFRKLLVAAASGLVFGLVTAGVLYAVLRDFAKVMITEQQNPVVIEVGNNNSIIGATGDEEIEEPEQASEAQKSQFNLYTAGSLCNKFLVGINEAESKNYLQTADRIQYDTGVIILATKEYVLILTTPNAVGSESEAQVTFYGGETEAAEVVAKDSDTGLAILRVELSQLTHSTQGNIEVAELGNSRNVTRGQYVIGVGNVTGEAGAVEVGQVISNSSNIGFVDSEFGILTTNIMSRSFSNGFIVGSESQVLGVITHGLDIEGEENHIMAMGITDLATLIQKLCNAEPIPYLGLHVSTITYVSSAVYDLPEGLYVKNIDINSPAMKAGVRAGDIVYSIGKKDLPNGRSLFDSVMALDPASDDTVVLHLLRLSGGEYKSMSVTLKVGAR